MYPVLLLDAAVTSAWGAKESTDGYGSDPTRPLQYPFESVAPHPVGGRKFDLELGVRARYVTLPTSILNSWFANEGDDGWAYVEPRPKIRGTAVGAEVTLRGRPANGIFYVEFVDSAMAPGYWDDADEDHLDGNFLVPSSGLGLITVGANSAYELRLVDLDQTNGAIGFSLLAGGGLGLGVLVGGVERWTEDAIGNPSYARYLAGEEPDSRNGVSRLYPLLDLNVGVRTSFGEMVSWRVEGGLHTLPYVGTSVAVGF